MDSLEKSMHYLSLAHKANLAELGEEPVGAAARAGKACLILVAQDASDHTWRRAKSFAAGTDQQCIRLQAYKDQLGSATGRQSLAIAALTSPGLALSLLQSLPDAEKHDAICAILQEKVSREQQRRAEARAHARNVRQGKRK